MAGDVEAALSAAFVGRACKVFRREFDWVFFFEVRRAIVVGTTWRIIAEKRIAFADTDHDQKFGNPQRIVGEDRANFLLNNAKVERLTVDPLLSDLALLFDNGAVVEIFNNSSGYEAWNADFPIGGAYQGVIALGGGGFAVIER